MLHTTHKPALNVLYVAGMCVEQQLYLEEALLRLDTANWCLINWGPPPAIVMGVSGKADLWIDQAHLKLKPIPVIQRYSGGGTVVIGAETLLVSFIIQQTTLPHVAPYPEALLSWSTEFYQPLFATRDFQRVEQDYTLAGKKCGGNAQYLAKERWVHHTSWLWNYSPQQMHYLLHPPKQPQYRQGRAHSDFLTPLCHHFPCPNGWIEALQARLHETFSVEKVTVESIEKLCDQPHRRTTRRLTL